MNKLFTISSLLFISCLLFTLPAQAVVRTSIATGAWNVAGTWDTGVPLAGDDAVIASGHTVSLAALTSITNLTINSGGTVNSNGFNMTVTGNLTINGTYTLSAGGPFSVTMSTAAQTFNGTGQMTGSMQLIFAANTTIAATANFTNNSTNNQSTTVNAAVTVTNNGRYTTAQNVRLTAATSTWTQGVNSFLSFAQEIGVGGASGNAASVLNASASGNTVEYTATANRDIKTPSTPGGNPSGTYYHLTVTGSSTKTMLAALTIDGNLTISSGSLDPDGFNINIRGNWTNNGTFSLAVLPQTVIFDGSVDQTIANPAGQSFNQLTVNKGGGTLTLNNNARADVGTPVLTMSGGNINANGNTLTLGSLAIGAGTLTRTAGQIIGKFQRWVNVSGVNVLFPMGTAANYRPATVNLINKTDGFLIIEHIGTTPGALTPNPFTDVLFLYYNTYNDGYWQLSVPGVNPCVSTNFLINLDGTGFTSFPIDGTNDSTRVLKRVSGTWQAGADPCVNAAAGCPNGVTGNVVSRNLISGFSGDYAFVHRRPCTPPAAPVISGPVSVCTSQLNAAYSCTGTASSTFTWTIPTANGTIDPPSSGVGVQSITIDWGAAGGSATVRVVENNGCSNSTPTDYAVTIHPVPTSSITGSANVTEFTDGEPYSVTNNAGYTYTWTITGGSVAGGQGTNAITVNWNGAGSGNVSVVATSPSCGAAAAQNLAVTIVSAYTSNGIGGGNWNVAATWTCLCVPAASSSVRIVSGDIVTLVALTLIKNITIDAGGELFTNTFQLTASGNVTVNGNMRFLDTDQLELDGNGTNTLGGTGTLTCDVGGIGTIDFDESRTIVSSANLTCTRMDIATIGPNVTITNNGTFTIDGDILGSNGTTSQWTNAANSRLNVGGAMLTTGLLEASASGNTVNYNGTAPQTTKVPLSSYYNLEVTSTSTVTLGGATTVTNTFNIISGTAQLAANDITVSDTTIVTGILSDNNGGGINSFTYLTVNAGGTVTTSGTATYSVSANLNMYGGTITSTAGTPTYNVTGTFDVPSGTATIGAGTVVFTITGATSITGTLTVSSATGAKTFGDFTINSGGTFNSTAASAFTVTGNMANNGTFTSGAATYNLSGSTKTISGTSGFTFGTGIVTVSGSYSNNTTITVPNLTVSGSLTNNSTANVTTTFGGAGTYTNAAGSTLNISAASITTTTFTASACANLVNYNGSAAQIIRGITSYCNLQVATTGGATATFSTTAPTTVSNNFTVVSGGIAAHTGSVDLTVSGSTSITGTLNFTTATTGIKTFNDVTMNAGGVWSNPINSPITVNGNIQHDGATFTSGTGLYTLAGVTKTISGSVGLTISNLTVSGSYTNNYTIAAGFTASTTGFSLAGAGTLAQSASSILNIGGNPTITNLAATVNPNTVYYVSGDNPQNVKATTYHHLIINKTGQTANLTGAVIVNGNITITAGTLDANGANTITLYGNWSNSGVYTGSTGTVIFTGAAAQTITGATTYNNLTINKTSLNVTLNSNITVGATGTLTFTDGNIVTGANYVIIAAGGTVAGAAQATGWVQGYLQKNVATGGPVTRNFEVGGASVYAPASFVFASVTIAGDFVVSTTDGDHPSIASSNITPTESLNRYWSVINSGTTFTTFDATYNFVNPGDLDVGVDPTATDFNGKRFDGITWSSVGIGTRAATSTQVTGEPLAAYPIIGVLREIALGRSTITSDIYTRVTGAALWNTNSTWIQYRGGSITYSTATTTVTGAGTTFLSQLVVGDVLMCQLTPGTVLGTVASIVNDVTLTLAALPSSSGSCDYGRQKVPSAADQIVYIGNPNVTAGGVDVTYDPASATVNQLVFYRHSSAIANTLTHNPGTTLTVNIQATVEQPNSNALTYLWNIANGTVNVTGSVVIGSNDATTTRVARIQVNNGTLTIGTGLSFNSPAGSPLPAVLDMSGGATGIVNVAGPVTLANTTGTITGGASSIFNYNGSTGVQTVTFGSALVYNNLHTNNTNASGAILGAAITTTNVTGNLRVQTGLLRNGGFAITGNATTFEVASGATFRMTGTTVFPISFTTYTFGPTSTTQYYQSNAQSISAQTYGHLHVEPSANTITHTFPASTTTVQGNLQLGNGTNTGVIVNGTGGLTVVDVNADILIRSNTTFSSAVGGSDIPSIFAGGNWTQNGAFDNVSTNSVTFDGAANSQIISASTVAFPNVTVAKGAGNTLSTSGGLTTVSTNNLTVSGGEFIAPTTLNINSTATSALTLNSGGTLTAGTTINITGNWTKNTGSIFNEGTGTVNFTGGTTPQTINGTAVADTFYNVTVLKSLAGDVINTGGGIVTITTNNLTITTGTVTAPATLNINGNMTLALAQFLTAGTTINASGNWTNNSGTFTPGTNTVVFNGAVAQQINGTAAAQTFNNFTVTKTGGTLDVGGSTIVLNITNTGTATVTLNSGTFAAGTAATINVSGNWTNNGGIFTPATGTVIFNNTTAAQLINGTGASETFNNVTIAKATGVGVTLTTSLATITMATCSLNACNNFNTTGTTTLNINGNLIIATPAANTFTAGATTNCGGDWTNNGGTFTPGTGTVTFNGTGAQQINGTLATQSFYNFAVAKTVATTLTVGGSTTTINATNNYTNTSGNYTAPATFNVTANVLLTAGTFTAGTTTTVGGNWTNNGGTFTPGLNTVTFNGTVTQLIGGTAASQTFYNVSKTLASVMLTGGSLATLTFNQYTQSGGDFNASTLTTFNINNTISHTAGTFTSPTGTIVKGAGNWTNSATFVHSSGTVQFNSSLSLLGISIYSFNNVTIAGGILTAPSAVNMNVAGNWTNNSSFADNSGTVTLNGTAAQTAGGTATTTFNNLTVNNSYATTAITLGAPVTVNGTLTLTDGHIITDAINLLIMGASSTVTLSGAPQDSSFVKGPVRHTVNVSTPGVIKIYPVGKGNSYRRMELTIDQNTVATTTYTGEMFNANATNGGCTTLPGTINKVSGMRYYDIAQSPATVLDAASIRMYFGCSDINDFVNDLPNLAVAKTNCPAAWTDLSGLTGGTSVCGAYQQGYIDASFTSFSRFALANKTGGANPLPIDLLTFDAVLNGNSVNLKWKTGTETNNDYFTIEKTKDSKEFIEVAIVQGYGTTSEQHSYSAVDNNPFEGTSYYRLKQTDFNKKFTYSRLVAINYSSSQKAGDVEFTVYPNPAERDATNVRVNLSGYQKNKEVLVVLQGLNGQIAFSKVVITDDNGSFLTAIDPEKQLAAGIYFVIGSSENDIFSRKLVVK